MMDQRVGVDFKYLYFELYEKAVEPYNLLLQAGGESP